jgi:hypothetical protein
VKVAADEVIGHKRKPGPAASEREEAADWLRQQLASGPRLAKDVIDEGDGYGLSKRTLQRAFREIGGQSRISGFPPIAEWSLPNCATNRATDTQLGEHGTLGTLGTNGLNPEEEEESAKFLSNGKANHAKLESVVGNGHLNDDPF